jgi:uncharacterized Zn finger protein
MARYFNYYGWYKPTQAKEVKGGIKAQSKRGAFARKWWSKRWTQVLESFHIGARLSRGRSYARKGQVASLNIEKGKVLADVQGSRAKPYKVTIQFNTYLKKQWEQVVELLIEQPIFAARLLGNEMPEEIESVFEKAKLPLFPKRKKDMETDCSCPDWSNPCKHIAAVFYLMAESFDNDPFLLFKLRGMEREDLLAALQKRGATKKLVEEPPNLEPEPLPLKHDDFWGQSIDPSPIAMPHAPNLHAALPKRLGPLSLWRSNKNFINEMESIYDNASSRAVIWFDKLSGV